MMHRRARAASRAAARGHAPPSRRTARARLGNHGTGATTVLDASPLASRCRSRFSTKMPWFGRAALGNSVENVEKAHRSIAPRRRYPPAPLGTVQDPLAMSSSSFCASVFSLKSPLATTGSSCFFASSWLPVSFNATA